MAGSRWEEGEWANFAKEFWRLRHTPAHKDRKYFGPTFMEAQKVLPLECRRDKTYYAMYGRSVVQPRIKSYLDQMDRDHGIEAGSTLTLPEGNTGTPLPLKGDEGIDYERLANLVIAQMRPEIEKDTETFVELQLEQRLKNTKVVSTGGVPAHMLDRSKSDHPAANPQKHKLRVTIFGIEEKNKNTARFNYLNHALDIRIWHGTEGHAAKQAADISDLTLIAINNPDLRKQVITEIKKSSTKFVFTSGGLSAVDAALQTFAATKGLRFTVPEHPSHQH